MTSTSRGYSYIREVTITFETEYMVNDSDVLCLAVSGSIPELGSWSAADSRIATESPKGSGKWSVSMLMTPGQQFFWKWVVVSRDRTRVVRWEHIDNREQTVGDESVIIQAQWDEPATTLPQSQRTFSYFI